MLGILSELTALSIEDPGFRTVFASTHFVPCPAGFPPDGPAAADAPAGIALRAPSETYDPLAPELLSLLDEHLFPVPGPYRSAEVVTALRSLGMQASMSRFAREQYRICVRAVRVCCGYCAAAVS